MQNARENTILRFAIIGCVLYALASVRAHAEETDPINDKRLAEIVHRQLLFAADIDAQKIDVNSENGIVTLTGSVDNVLSKYQAPKIAGNTKGVRSVVNRIAVNTVPIDDQQLEQDIRFALKEDPATESYDVDLSVENGRVTLRGVVQSHAEKNLSGYVVAGIRGVREVQNDLSVRADEKRSDSEIQHDIERRMDTSAWIDSRNVNVEVNNGHVTLEGSVDSVIQHLRIRDIAWVSGVQSLQYPQLTIREHPSDPRDRVRRETQITDDQIQRAIADALQYDPRVSGFEVEPTVRDRIVTLRGTVENLAAKNAAEKDAWNTYGVRRVRNLLRVRPTQVPADAKIEVAIERMLQVDPYVNRYRVKVDVINGHAFLYGSVNSDFAKLRVAEIVSRAGGVVFVTNHLQVDRVWLDQEDEELEENIEMRLSWTTDLASESIDVAVDEGVATLTGHVASFQQRRLAKTIASAVGVRRVINKLEVGHGESSKR